MKKPKSPYLYFFEGHRKELKNLNPEWSALRINRQVKINWNKLTRRKRNLLIGYPSRRGKITRRSSESARA